MASWPAGQPAPCSARLRLPMPWQAQRRAVLAENQAPAQPVLRVLWLLQAQPAAEGRPSVHRRPLLSQPAWREERHLGRADTLRGGITRDGPFLDATGEGPPPEQGLSPPAARCLVEAGVSGAFLVCRIWGSLLLPRHETREAWCVCACACAPVCVCVCTCCAAWQRCYQQDHTLVPSAPKHA